MTIQLARGRGAAILLLASAIFGTRCSFAQDRPPAPVQLYADIANGVSFVYPSGWALSKPLNGYLPDPVTSPEHPAIAAVTLSSVYPGTDFAGAELIYTVHRGASAESCKATLREIESPTSQATVNHVTYNYAQARDTAAMHQREDRVYTTLSQGRCYVFDLVLMTAGFGAVDGVQQLTQAQRQAIKRQLDTMLASVSYHAAPLQKHPHS